MNYPNRPLVQRLEDFKKVGPVSFHVPGHKNGILSGLPSDLRLALQYDLTELEGLDDLHEPNGVIEEAQQMLAELYSSDRSFFLVNGSTVGNLAMIYATCSVGDTVIVQRNAHKSVFHAIELTGARPVFVSPVWDSRTRTVGTVTAMQVKCALEAYPEAKAVILTYPTYYGTTGIELEETIHICHMHNVPVLVDEAHGAHFVVGEPFPSSALGLGADVVVHSAHKTLPAMTMASFLHVRSNLVDAERIAHYLQMLQSSSPSYVLMASLDDARAYVESYNEVDKMRFIEKRNGFINRLEQVPRLQTIETDDPLKLIVRVEGYSGFDLQKQLEMEGIYAELADPFQVLFVLPLLKEENNFHFSEIGNKIEYAIERLCELEETADIIEPPIFKEDISHLVYTSNELRQLKAKWISHEEAVDHVAAAAIIPYPPGIPLLLGGERVTEAHLQSLALLLQLGAKFQGAIRVHEKQILVVKRETVE